MSVYFLNSSVSTSGTTELTFPADVSAAYAVLAGFEASFGSDDHHVKSLSASVSTTSPDGDSVELSGSVKIKDDSDHSGGGSLYGMAIGQTDGDLSAAFTNKSWNAGDGETTVTFSSLAAPLSSATVFFESFKVTYGSNDHHVKKILLDAGNSTLKLADPVDNGDGTWSQEVSFTPNLEMKDDSGHSQSSDSDCDLLVMGVLTQ